MTRYIEKMELAEIAVAIGRPLSTTKRRLARATRRIAARMSGDPALADYVAGMGKREDGETVMKVGRLDEDIEREQRMRGAGRHDRRDDRHARARRGRRRCPTTSRAR